MRKGILVRWSLVSSDDIGPILGQVSIKKYTVSQYPSNNFDLH